jgi:hypothetical protein
LIHGENLLDARQARWSPLLGPDRTLDGRWTTDIWPPLEGRVINGGLRIPLGGQEAGRGEPQPPIHAQGTDLRSMSGRKGGPSLRQTPKPRASPSPSGGRSGGGREKLDGVLQVVHIG